MRKFIILTVVLIIAVVYFSAGGVTISKKTPIVILPAKTSVPWRSDILDTLLTSLEEKALELERFKVLSRVDLDRILEEKKLSLAGITESQAIDVGKLSGAKYAVLLHLLRFESKYSSDYEQYVCNITMSIKIYDLETGELLFVKKIDSSGFAKDSRYDAESYAIDNASYSIFSALREAFKQKAYVGDVKGKYVKLVGIDPSIVKKGQVFKTKGPLREGYIEVIEVEKDLVMAQIKYGEVKKGDVAKEYPIMPAWIGGGVSVGMSEVETDYSISPITFNFFGFSAEKGLGFYFETDIFGTFGDFTPFLFFLGGQYLFNFSRISIIPRLGMSIFGIYSESSEDLVLVLPGYSYGIRIVYEFNPSTGITIFADSSTYFGGGNINLFGGGFVFR